jgi:NADH-quinone oxidoreductase subunit H
MTSWEIKSLATRAAQSVDRNFWEAAIYIVIGAVGVAAFVALTGLVLIYAERKIAAHFQCRLGPMRVGWHGILQSGADAIKLLLKEDIVPDKADKLLHLIAPFFALLATMLALVVLPMSPIVQVADLNIGILYVVAVSGLGVFGVLIGGWSSNNKWSLLGAMRSGAQIISYEISATLALLVIILFSGTLQLSAIVESQAKGWWIWRAHGIGLVAFLMFLTASVAEINRTPFDIPEGESELTGGFHTEYSGLRFAFFFLSEFVNMFVAAALTVTLFLGGWMPFHFGDFAFFNSIMDLVPTLIWFWVKCAAIIFLMIWFRWTFPRLRVDQLMKLEWKILLPIGFVNLVLAAVAVVFKLYFFPATI